MRNLDFREITNARIASRVRQVIVLIIAIVIGMIISISVNAQQSYHKSNNRFYKSKFKNQIHQYANACQLLEKKRTHKQKSNVRFASIVKSKNKSTAEIDYFGKRLSNSNATLKPAQVKYTAVAAKL